MINNENNKITLLSVSIHLDDGSCHKGLTWEKKHLYYVQYLIDFDSAITDSYNLKVSLGKTSTI